jgi:hypothetical protein
MTDPVILFGTQSNGETLPVQVDATGRLVAEGLQGVEGPQGPKGDQGDQGIPGPIDLPPNPQEGQVLGWLNGDLAWVDHGSGSSFLLEVDYLVVAGGGLGDNWARTAYSGGGAGGLVNTIASEKTGGGGNGQGSKLLATNSPYQITVGAVGENSVLVGEGINVDAVAGGAGASGSGGSGGGGNPAVTAGHPGGTPTFEQGHMGAAGGGYVDAICIDDSYLCNPACSQDMTGGGGGGAGSLANGYSGGEGIQSAITGTISWYAGGGNGCRGCDNRTSFYPQAKDSPGSGGGFECTAQPGIVVVRLPAGTSAVLEDGDLIYTQISNGPLTSFVFERGSGTVSFVGGARLRKLISTTDIDLPRQQ